MASTFIYKSGYGKEHALKTCEVDSIHMYLQIKNENDFILKAILESSRRINNNFFFINFSLGLNLDFNSIK